jgi:hypothetical protein
LYQNRGGKQEESLASFVALLLQKTTGKTPGHAAPGGAKKQKRKTGGGIFRRRFAGVPKQRNVKMGAGREGGRFVPTFPGHRPYKRSDRHGVPNKRKDGQAGVFAHLTSLLLYPTAWCGAGKQSRVHLLFFVLSSG